MEVLLPVCEAVILWDGEERKVLVLATGRRPLLGTALLHEQKLVIQFTEGGVVTKYFALKECDRFHVIG